MKFLSSLFLLGALIGLVLCIVVRIFYPDGIYGIGLGSFYSFSMLATMLVIGTSLMRLASKD